MEEIIVHSESLYDGRLVKLDKHTVRLPDGEQSYREVVRHPGAVAIVAIDADQQVLMVRQFRLAAGQVMLEIPAGTLEPGEAPDVCAARELREETGQRPLNLEALGGIFVAPGYTTEYIHIFYTTAFEDAPLQQDADEFVELVRVPLVEAVDMIDRGEISDAKTITGLLRVARRLGV